MAAPVVESKWTIMPSRRGSPGRTPLAGQARNLHVSGKPPRWHDLQIWTLTSDTEVAAVHLMARDDSDARLVLTTAQNVLEGAHGIAHATLRVEPDAHSDCAGPTW